MSELTVVTGIPGTRIRRSLAKLAEHSSSVGGRDLQVFSVEEALQEKARPLVKEHFPVPAATVVQTFLLPRAELRRVWLEAWSDVLQDVDAALEVSDVVLTLHLAYFHQLTREYFVAADMPTLIAEMTRRASRIVTLVDDIYDCHQALVAGGSASGMLTPPRTMERALLDLLRVLDWRSIEVMLSESLSASISKPHFVMAVKHPIETVFDLLFSDKRPIYFSHPISEPRRLHAAGQVGEAAAFVQRMTQIVSRLQADSVVIEPTAIDELRFDADTGRLLARWPFAEDGRTLLYEPPEPAPFGSQENMFPAGWSPDGRPSSNGGELVEHLVQAIQDQIDARDHGLVEQSAVVASYRPIYEGNASRGVQEELLHYGRLVALGLRQPGGAIVFSPAEDRAAYPRRRLLTNLIPEWHQQGFITGEPEAVDELTRRVSVPDENLVEELLQGNADALLRLVSEAGLDLQPDERVIPGGALGATEATKRQATASSLAEQAQRASDLYLDQLVERGVIRLVETEHMFYSELEQAD